MDILVFIIVATGLFALGYIIGINQQQPSLHDSIKPGQCQALAIVWKQIYGMQALPPKIIWVERGDLHSDGKGFYNPLTKKARNCVNGLFWPYGIMIAWPEGSKFSQTSFCHELYHAKIFLEKGIVDAAHADKAWTDIKGPIAKAIKALEDAGL